MSGHFENLRGIDPGDEVGKREAKWRNSRLKGSDK